MATWRCVQHCGACCNLAPADRPHLAEYLSSAELALYLSMVGEDGWCIHYDPSERKCQIYEQRPRFCRVEPNTFQRMYAVALEEFEDFAIECCYQQIEGVYAKIVRRCSATVKLLGMRQVTVTIPIRDLVATRGCFLRG